MSGKMLNQKEAELNLKILIEMNYKSPDIEYT